MPKQVLLRAANGQLGDMPTFIAELAQQLMPEETKRSYQLRKKLQDYLFSHLDHLELNGHPEHRLPGNLNVSFAYVEGEALMMAIKNVAVSSGSACTSATTASAR